MATKLEQTGPRKRRPDEAKRITDIRCLQNPFGSKMSLEGSRICFIYSGIKLEPLLQTCFIRGVQNNIMCSSMVSLFLECQAHTALPCKSIHTVKFGHGQVRIHLPRILRAIEVMQGNVPNESESYTPNLVQGTIAKADIIRKSRTGRHPGRGAPFGSLEENIFRRKSSAVLVGN